MITTRSAPDTTVVRRLPRYEGSNICTWIGFKHVMYLVEEAILDHLRQAALAPRTLFEEYGLGVDIVDSSVRILHALHIDDVVRVEVTPTTKPQDKALTFAVQMFVSRDTGDVKSLTGKVKVVLQQTRAGAPAPPAELQRFVVSPAPLAGNITPATPADLIGRGVNDPDDDVIRRLVPRGANAFAWKWHIPYFYCHYTDRIQHSGYLRLMEEVVDLFLASRGISIKTMLDTRRWIPVVPNARVEILADALMEETIYTVYTVEDIYKDVTYTSRMDCYVVRDEQLIHTATGKITHGYAEIVNRRDWKLVNFDEHTINALKGSRT
jgi:acyl-CoA thioesterase FadM